MDVLVHCFTSNVRWSRKISFLGGNKSPHESKMISVFVVQRETSTTSTRKSLKTTCVQMHCRWNIPNKRNVNTQVSIPCHFVMKCFLWSSLLIRDSKHTTLLSCRGTARTRKYPTTGTSYLSHDPSNNKVEKQQSDWCKNNRSVFFIAHSVSRNCTFWDQNKLEKAMLRFIRGNLLLFLQGWVWKAAFPEHEGAYQAGTAYSFFYHILDDFYHGNPPENNV